MRVLILNQPFHPDVVATAQIAKDLADELVARGHEVTAIASRSIYGQTGRALPRRETVDGIEIVRVGASRFGKRTILGRVLDFAGYYLGAAWSGLRRRRFDAVVCLTTPPYIAEVGLLLRRLRGGRVLYWLMDVYPDVMIAHSMLSPDRAPHRLLRRWHARILDRVDATVALGRCMKERLVCQGASPERIEVVPVWGVAGSESPAPTPARDNAYRREWGVGDRMLVMYAGNFGLAHDVETFLSAAERLREDDRIRFAFVGGGARKAEVAERVEQSGLRNCVVADYQPRERLDELLAGADLHLVTMLPEWWGLVVPSKFFGVCDAARPSIFIGPPQSEVARCIADWSSGETVSPGDVDALVERLGSLAEAPDRRREMGERAASGAASWASRKPCAGRLVELIEGDAPSQQAARRRLHAGAARPEPAPGAVG